jgi:hypothetical protein
VIDRSVTSTPAHVGEIGAVYQNSDKPTLRASHHQNAAGIVIVIFLPDQPTWASLMVTVAAMRKIGLDPMRPVDRCEKT